MALGGAVATSKACALRKSPDVWTRNEKHQTVRHQNIVAARAVADAIRTSLGPRGMDKMIQDAKGGVVITNDGATIMKEMNVMHPAAKMLVELSRAQDIEVGDGTTSVVILAGAMLNVSLELLERHVHPQNIAESFLKASKQSEIFLKEMASPVNASDRESLIQAATTSLSSKVVSQNSALLSPLSVDSVMKVVDPARPSQVDLKDIRIVKKLGGTVEDSKVINGLMLIQHASHRADGPKTVSNANIGVIQFCLSPPKTDIQNNIVIKSYTDMDRIMKEERLLIAKIVKQIASTGCNVLLIQKSILRDAVTDLAADFLAKAKIMTIKDIERDEVETICRAIGATPIASLDHFSTDKFGRATMVEEEVLSGGEKVVIMDTSGTSANIKGVQPVSILLRGSNHLILDETDRSLHDALCCTRCIVRCPYLLPGGGAAEMQLNYRLLKWSRTLTGVEQLCVKAFANALEIICYTLSENAGLQPLQMISQLRHIHAQNLPPNAKEGSSCINFGVNVRKGAVGDMFEDHVVQPLMVTTSAIKLATETVVMILKIDDVVACR